MLNHLRTANCQLYGDKISELLFDTFGTRYHKNIIYSNLELNGWIRKLMEKIANEQDAEQ